MQGSGVRDQKLGGLGSGLVSELGVDLGLGSFVRVRQEPGARTGVGLRNGAGAGAGAGAGLGLELGLGLGLGLGIGAVNNPISSGACRH